MSEAIIAELTTELVNSQDQQLALYELSQAMRRKQSIGEAADELVRLVAQTMKVRVAGAVIAVPDRPPTSSCQPAGAMADGALQAWLDQVKASRTYVLDNEGQDFESLLVLPMQLNDQIAGALVVADKVDGPLASPDRKLGQAMANQAGIYFENLLFAEQRVAEARTQTELAMARDVQMRLLPDRPPEIPGLDVFGFSKPALQVGGDAYDFFVDGEGRFHFCTGDVSGKGMSAALLMAMMRTALRNSWRFNKRIGPAAAIERTNTSLYDDFTETGMFATLLPAATNPLRSGCTSPMPVIHRSSTGRETVRPDCWKRTACPWAC